MSKVQGFKPPSPSGLSGRHMGTAAPSKAPSPARMSPESSPKPKELRDVKSRPSSDQSRDLKTPNITNNLRNQRLGGQSPKQKPNGTVSKLPSQPIRKGLLPKLNKVIYSIDNDVLKCPICLDVFKSPRVLPCGHTTCYECLNSVIAYIDPSKAKDSFQCPVCQKPTKPRDGKQLKQRWAHQFPVNAVIVRILKNATVKNQTENTSHKAFCDVCLVNSTTRPAVAYCNTCLEHHCEVCTKHHERREESRTHDITSFSPKLADIVEREESTVPPQPEIKTIKGAEGLKQAPNDKVVRIDTGSRGRKASEIEQHAVMQTVTSVDAVNSKVVMKLGYFSGKSPGDKTTPDFRGAVFLTESKVVLSDHANKKLKLFDVSHKTRVELITELTLRVSPSHACRVDNHTVAVITERSGTFHIRLFTIREKIQHFVHRTLSGVPLGIGCMQNSLICTFLGHNSLLKYRLTRAQQIKVGEIRYDISGNDIFRYPGALCSGRIEDTDVVYVADEMEFGVVVTAIDTNGAKKSSIFFELPNSKPKSSKQPSRNGSLKSGRAGKSKNLNPSTTKRDDASDTTTESDTGKPPEKRQSSDKSRDLPTERLSGRHTFRRVDEYGRPIAERKSGREIERTPMARVLSPQYGIDSTLERTLNEKLGRPEGKAVERAIRRKDDRKGTPQQSLESTLKLNGELSVTVKTKNTPIFTSTPNSTLGTGTVSFASQTKLDYKTDSMALDDKGNVYACLSNTNKVYQLSADGRIVRDLLSDKDGLVSPKIICFSPDSSMFLVTCVKSNRVAMFKLK